MSLSRITGGTGVFREGVAREVGCSFAREDWMSLLWRGGNVDVLDASRPLGLSERDDIVAYVL
jgi:hypothetical protein